MTERELQDAVIELAQLLGWRCAHFRPARVMRGGRETYETPFAADGKGFPDLVLVRAGRLIFAELKSAKGVVSPEQAEWIADLERVQEALTVKIVPRAPLPEAFVQVSQRLLDYSFPPAVRVFVWRPVDWLSGHVESVLR